MAESIPSDIKSDRNFILAKLVSLFGDSVDFDVINIVAQENDWSEEKCTESLNVLGEYKNVRPAVPSTEVENLTLGDYTIATSKLAVENMSQNRNTSKNAATTFKAPLLNHPGSGAGSAQLRSAGVRHNSPIQPGSPRAKERSSESEEHHAQVKKLIESGTPVIIILRGLPGSGKSTLAKQLLSLPGAKAGCSQSADDFFLRPRGGKGSAEYQFDPLRLAEAHEHCRVQVLRAIAHGVSPIIIDNTNTQSWEMMPYVEMAIEPWNAEVAVRKIIAERKAPKNTLCSNIGPSRNLFKGKRCPCGYTVMDKPLVPYEVELLEPLTWWYQNPSRLAKMNQHSVSQRKINQMLTHFEFGLTGKNLVKQVIKKKYQNNSASIPPSLMSIRPHVNEKKPLVHKAGAPLFNVNTNKNSGNELDPEPKNSLQQKVPRGNVFQRNSVNQFQNMAMLSPGPYPEPTPCHPTLFSMGFNSNHFPSSGIRPSSHFDPYQLKMVRNEEQEMTNPRKPFQGTSPSELFPIKLSTSNPLLFSGTNATSGLSLRENQYGITSNTESNEMNAQAHSSKLDPIGPNPFLQSSNSLEKHSETRSASDSDCVEMTEEEEREWHEINASKWVDWKSSDEESENVCGDDSNEPKPERPHPAHMGLVKSSDERTSPRNLDIELQEESKEIGEWETEGIDPLISWNLSKSCNDDPTEPKIQGPLPPRSPKRKRPVEETSKSAEGVEALEEATGDIKNVEFDLIKEIRCFLKALGINNEGTDALKQAPDSTENCAKPSANLHSLDVSNLQADLLTEDPVNLITLDEKVNTEVQSECAVSPLPVVSFPQENPLPVGSKVLKEDFSIEIKDLSNQSGNSGELVDIAISGTVERVSVDNLKCTDMYGKSENVAVHTDVDINQSESLKDCNITFNDVINQVDACQDPKDHTSEDCDVKVEVLIMDHDNQDVAPKTNDNFRNPNEDDHPNSVFDRIDLMKNSVLKSLLLGIEKANSKGNEELEKGSLHSVSEISEKSSTSKLDAVELKMEKDIQLQGIILPKSFPEAVVKEETTKQWESVSIDMRKDPKVAEIEKGPLQVLPLASPVENDMSENVVECKILRAHQKEQTSYDTLPSVSGEPEIKDGNLNQVAVIEGSPINGDQLLISFTSSANKSPSSFILKQTRNPEEELTDLVESNEPSTSCEMENAKGGFIMFAPDSEILKVPVVNKAHDEALPEENSTKPSGCLSKNNENISDMMSESEWESAEDTLLDESSGKLDSLSEINAELAEELEIQGIKHFCLADAEASTSSFSYFEQDVEGEVTKSSNEHLILVDCDERVNFPTEQISVSSERGSVIDADDNREMLPLVLNSNFVELLCQKFGNPYEESLYESTKLPSGQTHEVTVNIPTSLARKLHECWLKTQWDAILVEDEVSQNMILEDELLARQLQEFEKEDLKYKSNESNSSFNTPNLREIMDMEMAMAMYKADQSKKVQSSQRNDMSTRLSWDLLTKEFPQIHQDIITEIFSAYKFSYAKAREALLSSLPDYERDVHEEAVKEVVSPEAIAAQEKALMEKAKMESLKYQRSELVDGEEDEDEEEEDSWEVMVDEARKSASLNRKLQKERHAQAQAANRSGMASAAAYYCQMATLHKQKAEEANRRAANILSKVFTGDYGGMKGTNIGNSPITPPPSTLDMHSMSVLEAVRVMNAFLDAHAEWLRREKNQRIDVRKGSPVKMTTLFLVTGRGMNSQGGIPRIKPAVERQLEKRGVWYEEMNPGLLRVMVSSNLPVTKKT